MQDAVSEWPTGGQTSVPWRLSRSLIDSVGPVGAEFARNAEYARLVSTILTRLMMHRSFVSARSIA